MALASITPKGLLMFAIPRRYSHFVFGVIQSGLTSLIAAGIASFSLLGTGHFFSNWLASWLISWAMMLPIVLSAAPAIRSVSLALTRDEPTSRTKASRSGLGVMSGWLGGRGRASRREIEGADPMAPLAWPLGSQIWLSQMAFQHGDGREKLVEPGSQISGERRIRDVLDVENCRSLFLVMDVRVDEMGLRMQIGNERLQFHIGAEIGRLRSEVGSCVHGFVSS